jgi:predicted CXXCH cytochrome family protein
MTTHSTTNRQLQRRGRAGHSYLLKIGLILTVAAVALGGWYFGWYRPRPIDANLEPGLPAPDPRLAYTGPFKNVHPDVAYVNDALCAECHRDIAKTFSRHPMARTLMPIDAARLPPLDAKAHNPFEALGQRFQVQTRDGKVLQSRTARDENGKPLFQQDLAVHFAIGSGTHAHSYLSIQGSTILQTPVTWFTQSRRWDLSPGFVHNVLAGRRVGADCLYCHGNGANEDPRDELVYREPLFPNGHGIGCQRCHGPGAAHVKAPGLVKTDAGILDPTIVNPKHLAPHLRESICWQCHLEGDVRVLRRGRQRYDFRPGMPLEDFLGVFVDAGETNFDDVVNHVEQMTQSRCYQKSLGPKQLGCVSCHDPHEKPLPETVVAHYRQACLKCHQEEGCALPRPMRLAQHKDDSCVACHMPAFPTSNIGHVSSSDHRIPRKAAPRKTERPPSLRTGDVQDLVSVFAQQRGKSDPELDRDRALAAAMLGRRGRKLVNPLGKELEAAAKRDPSDLAVRAQFGLTLLNAGEAAKALPLLQDILARQADHESALLGHAIACAQLGKVSDSLASWRRLVQLAPSHGGYRQGLIELLMRETRWEEAATEAQAWIAMDPGIPDARALLRAILAQLGRMDDAQEQHRILTELTRLPS